MYVHVGYLIFFYAGKLASYFKDAVYKWLQQKTTTEQYCNSTTFHRECLVHADYYKTTKSVKYTVQRENLASIIRRIETKLILAKFKAGDLYGV